MFRLDYISCCLTVLSTVLLGRKNWTGLVLASVNSAIVCVIGVRTSQFGFIPANLFCIGVYGLSLRSWIHDPKRASKLTEEPEAALDAAQLEGPESAVAALPVANEEDSATLCGRRAHRFARTV